MTDKQRQSTRKKGRPRSPEAREAAALALATGATIRSAAEQVGVNESTLRLWKSDPEFVAQIAAFRAEITEQTIGLEARLRAAALVRAGQSLQNPDDRIGVRAADVLLRNTGRSGLVNLDSNDADGTLLAYLRSLD